MKEIIVVLVALFFAVPSVSFAAGLTPQQAESLVAVVQSSPRTPADIFVPLITSFSHITVSQATSLITVVQAAPGVAASAFINLLTSFTADMPVVQATPPAAIMPPAQTSQQPDRITPLQTPPSTQPTIPTQPQPVPAIPAIPAQPTSQTGSTTAPAVPAQPAIPPIPPTPPIKTAISCSGVVSDNFNSYSTGSIVGQGGWFDRANGVSWIVSTTTKGGGGALYSDNTGADSVITKTGPSASTDGAQCYWVYPQNPQVNVGMGVYEGSWDGPIRTVMEFTGDGHVAYIDPRVDKFVEFDTYNANTWNLAQIQWRSSDDTARFRVNNDAWSDWIPLVHQWNSGVTSFTGFDTVGFMTHYLGTGGVYIDNLN